MQKRSFVINHTNRERPGGIRCTGIGDWWDTPNSRRFQKQLKSGKMRRQAAKITADALREYEDQHAEIKALADWELIDDYEAEQHFAEELDFDADDPIEWPEDVRPALEGYVALTHAEYSEMLEALEFIRKLKGEDDAKAIA